MAALMSYDEAFACIAAAGHPLESESAALDDAVGRVIARDVHAAIDVPQRPLSAMDGYAVRDADIEHLPVTLPIAGKVFPGDAEIGLPAGACIAVFTGSPMPYGADRVIVRERVQSFDGTILIAEPASGSRHLRKAGSDVARDHLVLSAGSVATPLALVAAGGCDLAALPVIRQPRMAILSTGDELVPAGSAGLSRRSVPDSVSAGFVAMARHWGAGTVSRRHLSDTPEAMRGGLEQALETADLVVVIGGASVGERDFARRTAVDMGMDLGFAGVAMRPGKPAWFGRLGDRLVLGLPGNPAAAMMVARLFAMPLLAAMAGRGAAIAADWRTLPLLRSCTAVPRMDFFARARRSGEMVDVLDAQQSSGQAGLAGADLVVRLGEGEIAVSAGAMVPALAF